MKIVFEKQLNETEQLTIRYPLASDAVALTEYVNALSREQTFVRFQGEEMSLEAEIEFLLDLLERIASRKATQLVALINEQIAGFSGIALKDKIESHEGVFGISISAQYRSRGIGKILMELTLNEAIEQLSELKIVTLGVFETNVLAQKMYQKFGFKEYGRLPKGVKHKNSDPDHVFMYKEVRA